MHISKLAMEMDLDAALNELGMLSTVTDSRKDYLNEQARRRTSSCFSLLQINPEFVTRLGPVCYPLKPEPDTGADDDDDEAPRSLRAGSAPHLEAGDDRVARHKRTKPRFSRPYHVPKHASTGRLRQNDSGPNAARPDSMTHSGRSRDLNSDPLPAVSFLTRSKSVDDLSKTGRPAKLVVGAGVTSQHQELEQVSKHLRDLQVSS